MNKRRAELDEVEEVDRTHIILIHNLLLEVAVSNIHQDNYQLTSVTIFGAPIMTGTCTDHYFFFIIL